MFFLTYNGAMRRNQSMLSPNEDHTSKNMGAQMVKLIAMCAAATFVLYLSTLVLIANSQATSGRPNAIKDDRLDSGDRAAPCSQYTWPYYDSACLYDSQRPASEVRKVRVVPIGRLQPWQSNAD